MLFSQKQYSILQRPTRHMAVKIDLINENEVVVDSFEGVALDGNITIDAESNYRRVGNLTLSFNKTLIPSSNSKIWFNRRLGVHMGLKDLSDEITWFNLGKFAIDEIDLQFSSTEKIINLSLKDYMAFLDGNLGGTLGYETQIIAQGTTINNAIRTTVSGLSKVLIEDIVVNGSNALVPYDISKPSNGNIYDLLKELNDLYMGYEFFFDADGRFIYQKIKDNKTDPVRWDFTQDRMNLALNYNSKIKFNNIRNSIYVWGRQLDSGIKIKWVFRNRYSRSTIAQRNQINNQVTGDICFVSGENLSYYWNGAIWQTLDFNVIPQFNIENIGEKIATYNDDKVFDENQAMLRCEYELKEFSNFAETIDISSIPIYLLDVNNLIKVNISDFNISGNYLVKNIGVSFKLDSDMSIQAIKMYY